jgi:Spy/CpxP family protein refolding chaperone
MKQIYLATNVAAVTVLAAAVLLFAVMVSNMRGQARRPAAAYAGDGPSQETNVRLVVTFPPRINKLLDLSANQEAQLQAVSGRFQNDLVAAEQDGRSAFSALQKAVMNAQLSDVDVKQRQGQLIAANAKRVQVNASMLGEMRKVLTSDQLTRLSPELPIERHGLQLVVQLPEGLSAIGLTRDQESQLQTVAHSREQAMIALSRKEKAARAALEKAVLNEQFNESIANQRRDELISVLSDQVELNTGILLEARKILTPDQLKRLDDMTPGQ